jgi:hypothetical protein
VTADHDAGLDSSVEIDHQNPDIEYYDDALSDLDDLLKDEDETPGEAETTDDLESEEEEETGTEEEEDKRIPKSRLDEVIAERNTLRDRIHQMEVESARKEAQLEARLSALEKPLESKPQPDPLDDLLAGEAQDVLDRLQEDPINFVNVIRNKAKADAIAEMRREQEETAANRRISQALDRFVEEHSDFTQHAPKLIEAIDNNPIHNAISAYAYEVEIPALKAAHEAEMKGFNETLEKAKKEAFVLGKKQAIKEIQAKGGASVLDGSTSTQTGKVTSGAGIETGRDPQALRDKITADLKQKRGVSG